MLTVKYSEDSGAVATAKANAIIGAGGNYNLYMVMCYGKALIFADGTIQIKG
jgi:hypothetical protein